MQYFDETGSCGCTGLNSACHRTISACRVNAGKTALNNVDSFFIGQYFELFSFITQKQHAVF